MAHNPTNGRRLAALEPESKPDPKPKPKPSVKRYVNPSTNTTAAVYNLTNHFSRLNPNPNTKSPKYPHSQTKALSKSANLESSNHSLGQGKRVVSESGKEEVGKKELGMKTKEVKNGIGKRVSFCDAQVELANFLVTNGAKLVAADMAPFIQIHAIGFARKVKDSLDKFTSKNLALSLKKEFDGVYGPAWHCIVGSSFGSFVTHSVGGFLYFQLDQKLYILLFKTTVKRVN